MLLLYIYYIYYYIKCFIKKNQIEDGHDLFLKKNNELLNEYEKRELKNDDEVRNLEKE